MSFIKLLKIDVSFVLYCLLFNLLGLINELFKISVFKISIFVDFMLGMNEIPLLSSCSLFVCIGISPIVYMYSEIFFTSGFSGVALNMVVGIKNYCPCYYSIPFYYIDCLYIDLDFGCNYCYNDCLGC